MSEKDSVADARIAAADFRRKAPRRIDGIEILRITRFDGGSAARGTNALAAAVTRANGAYSTHTLIYQHEKGSWLLSHGHYDIPTFAKAAADADIRTLA